MQTMLVFVWVYSAMISMSFWEAYVEGRNAWDRHKLGWKIKIRGYKLTAYHFYLFFVMWPLMLSLPLVINGWNIQLFGILVSAYASGLVLEDIMWFVVNPKVSISEWSPRFASYYPWITLGRFHMPVCYFAGIAVAVISWFFLWQ